MDIEAAQTHNWPHGARQRRLEVQTWEVDENKNGVIRWKDGELFPGAHVESNQLKFTMNSQDQHGLYPDDVLGVVRDLYQTYVNFNPNDTYNSKILSHLQTAIELADRRAVERHGYSGSERERSYEVKYPQVITSQQAVEFVKGAAYVVEASSVEWLSIFERYQGHVTYDSNEWVHQSMGLITYMGQMGEKPIAVHLSIRVINGKKVVIYYPSGSFVDWTVIEAWFDKHCNPYLNGRRCRTDAQNFHNCLYDLYPESD